LSSHKSESRKPLEKEAAGQHLGCAGGYERGEIQMFIWDFVADTVLGQIVDWIYGQIVGFLGDFFMQMETWEPTGKSSTGTGLFLCKRLCRKHIMI